MSWNGVERRSKKRYGVKNSTVKYRKGAFVLFAPASDNLLLLNVSETGCHFITKEDLELGQKLSLTIEAPRMAAAAHVKGRVVWARKSEDQHAYRVGVDFDPPSDTMKKRLKSLLDNAVLENVEVSTRVVLKEIEKL